jgi:hypothetical protein
MKIVICIAALALIVILPDIIDIFTGGGDDLE